MVAHRRGGDRGEKFTGPRAGEPGGFRRARKCGICSEHSHKGV